MSEVYSNTHKLIQRLLVSTDSINITDIKCSYGTEDKPFEEKQEYVSIALVVSGAFNYRKNRNPILLTQGSLLLIGAEHYYECSHHTNCGDRCISFQFQPKAFESISEDLGIRSNPFLFAVDKLPPTSSITNITSEILTSVACNNLFELEELSYSLAGIALKEISDKQFSARESSYRDRKRITDVILFIEEYFRDPLSIEDMSSIVGFSPYHFLRTFKRVTGITPHKFILNRRLREAAFLLRTTDLQIINIAYQCGFGDLSNFNHSFHNTFDYTPSQWRNRIMKTNA